MPNKPTRWEIKLWPLCESSSGYLLDWDVYKGKAKPNDWRVGLRRQSGNEVDE